MKRTERLFAIAQYLRGRRTGVTAEALAERFEVTVRTIYRDLDSLRDAKLPVHSERGRGGGFALDRSYALPPVNFTAREAAMLVFAGDYLDRMRSFPFVRALREAIDKVRAALPKKAQRELASFSDRLRWVGVPVRDIRPEVRAVLEEAWFEQTPFMMRYAGRNGETERRVRLDSVVVDRVETLLNCFDLDKQARRQFQADRIVAARMLESSASS
ncbi:MAG: HTH domain-containing protein [Myxococcota bacterium]